MNLLTITNLFPDKDQPRHGIFVEERLGQIVADETIRAEVVALRPGMDKTSWTDVRNAVPITYLPVPTLPLLTNWIDPILWYRAAKPLVADLLRCYEGDTVIDAHFLYPDGVAATILGEYFRLPVVLTARGTDVNVKSKNPVMRQWIKWACRRSAAVITVSEALKSVLIDTGIDSRKITVLRNGVDLDKFSPYGDDAHQRHRKEGLALLSVGHLLEDKGHHFAIEALVELPGAKLTIIGEGDREASFRALAEHAGVANRVEFLGHVPHSEMAAHYRTADVTILASAREGMPNVVLESIACGTRVVASGVGGIGEVVTSASTGFLMKELSTDGLVNALTRFQHAPCPREETRAYAVDRLGWQGIIAQQRELYREVAGH